ncbi:MAG: hypothetical protein AABX16_02810 [Nanoarchaeota archaeon]
MENLQKIEWILRVALFGEFLGHGIFALQLKTSFVQMIIAVLGVSESLAGTLLSVIGIMDFIVAFCAIIFPLRIILMWAAFWGFITALARPLAGDPIWDFVERWANWGVPLALLYVRGMPKNLKEYFK